MLTKSLELLGLNTSACIKDVREAYWKRALVVHPDKGGTEADFQELVGAYREVIEHVQKVPCEHCTEGFTTMLDKNFRTLSTPCPHCMGTRLRG